MFWSPPPLFGCLDALLSRFFFFFFLRFLASEVNSTKSDSCQAGVVGWGRVGWVAETSTMLSSEERMKFCRAHLAGKMTILFTVHLGHAHAI